MSHPIRANDAYGNDFNRLLNAMQEADSDALATMESDRLRGLLREARPCVTYFAASQELGAITFSATRPTDWADLLRRIDGELK